MIQIFSSSPGSTFCRVFRGSSASPYWVAGEARARTSVASVATIVFIPSSEKTKGQISPNGTQIQNRHEFWHPSGMQMSFLYRYPVVSLRSTDRLITPFPPGKRSFQAKPIKGNRDPRSVAPIHAPCLRKTASQRLGRWSKLHPC